MMGLDPYLEAPAAAFKRWTPWKVKYILSELHLTRFLPTTTRTVPISAGREIRRPPTDDKLNMNWGHQKYSAVQWWAGIDYMIKFMDLLNEGGTQCKRLTVISAQPFISHSVLADRPRAQRNPNPERSDPFLAEMMMESP